MTADESWTDTTSARERVRAVVETLGSPATVTEIAEEASVAWATADSELDRLQADNRVREVSVDGTTKYAPNPARQFVDAVLARIESHERRELESQVVDYRSRIDALQADHGADSLDEFRRRLTDDDRPVSELREIQDVVATWEALELELRLTRHALALYEDVREYAEREAGGHLPA